MVGIFWRVVMAKYRFDNLDEESLEYFCNGCGQLRLALKHRPTRCLNCMSTNLVVGAVGTLDKEKLKAAFDDNG